MDRHAATAWWSRRHTTAACSMEKQPVTHPAGDRALGVRLHRRNRRKELKAAGGLLNHSSRAQTHIITLPSRVAGSARYEKSPVPSDIARPARKLFRKATPNCANQLLEHFDCCQHVCAVFQQSRIRSAGLRQQPAVLPSCGRTTRADLEDMGKGPSHCPMVTQHAHH